jgi:hypothetical protein
MQRETMKTIAVKVDDSTYRWLAALAKANSINNECGMEDQSTPGGLLAQAAFCFADHAGRRTGSWEAYVGRQMLDASGFQNEVSYKDNDRCAAQDAARNSELMAEWDEVRSYNFFEAVDFSNVFPYLIGQQTRQGWRE